MAAAANSAAPEAPKLQERTPTSLTAKWTAPIGASGYYLPEVGDNNRTMFGSLLSWSWKEVPRPGGEQEVEIDGKKYKLPPNIHTGTTVTVASLPDRPDLSYVFRYTPVTLKGPASGDVAEVVKGTTSKESEVFRVATLAEEVKRLTEARKPLEEENKRLSDKIIAAEGEKRNLEQAKREVEEKLRRAEKAALDKQKELEEKLRAAGVSVADTGHTRMQYQEMEKKHDAMFKSYGKLESDINRLKDEKAAVEKERASVKTTLDDVNSKLAEANSKITALETAKAELAAENTRLTTALADATEKGRAFQEEADKLAARLNEALLAAAAAADLETDGNKAAVESLKAELEKAKRDSDDTIASLQVLLQQHKEKLQALTADKESSQQEIDEFKDGLRELTSELSSARVEGYRLRGQLAAAQQQTTEANKKSESLSSEVTALETEKAAMKGQLETALGELETTKTDLQSTKEVLTRTAAELESAKSNGGAMTEALEQAKQKAQEEADSTRKERDQAKAELEEVLRQAADEKKNAENTRAEAEKTRADAEKASAEAETARMERDQARAEAEEARRQAASEKEEAERASTDLAGRLASLTEVVATAAKKHQSEISELKAELEKERKEKKALQDAHDAAQVGVCEIEDDRRRKAELIATLTAEHTRMEEEAKENAATLKKFKDENADLQAQIFDLKAKLEDKEASHGSASVIARLKREIDAVNQRVNQLKAANDAKANDVARLELQVTELSSERDRLQRQNVTLEATVEKIEEHNDRLQATSIAYIEDIGKTEAALAKEKEEVSRLRGIITALGGSGTPSTEDSERRRSRTGSGVTTPIGFPAVATATAATAVAGAGASSPGGASAAVVGVIPTKPGGRRALTVTEAVAAGGDAIARRGLLRAFELRHLRPVGAVPPPPQIKTSELEVLLDAPDSQVSTPAEVERALQLNLMGFSMASIITVVKRHPTVDEAARALTFQTVRA